MRAVNAADHFSEVPMTFVPFDAANSIGDRFLDLLQRHGIQPPVGSTLEDELLSMTQLIEVMKNPALAQGPNQVAILRSAAGLHDFAAKPAGRMMMQMVGSFAEFERAMIRERTSAGLAAARAEGRIGGRRKKLDAAKRREIAESVISGRKTGAEMARLYNVSAPS